MFLRTDTSARVSWRVGVTLVALAAEGAVRVVAEAVVAADGSVRTLVDI